MAVKKTTEIIINCDYCKEKILKKANKIKFIVGQVGQGTDWHECPMEVNLKGIIPYSTPNADICGKCAKGFLLKAINELESR